MVARFNLVDDAWISVVDKDTGSKEFVSLSQLFQEAARFERLAGDTLTQDFAVLRIILAITHTVFSRLDAEGLAYAGLDLDDRWTPKGPMDPFNVESYEDDMLATWEVVWNQGQFPDTMIGYLNKWHERFYLFDAHYPFMQVTLEDYAHVGLIRRGKSVENGTEILGKTINRTISESGNKISLFSPKCEGQDNKSILSEAELARWLITFHGYTGTFDKTTLNAEKYTGSKGWLFDIGGIFIEGDNLFETLMLNTMLIHEFNSLPYHLNLQRPCWELTPGEKIQDYLSGNDVDNLAELYTLWSRAIYIDPETNLSEPFSCEIVKLPELDHEDPFIEPMTLLRMNKTGPNKNKYTPRKHPANQALWRSFGLLLPSSTDSSHIEPGIMTWYSNIKQWGLISDRLLTIHSVSMKDDGNATSWVPVDEICDHLNFYDFILEEVGDDKWLTRIHGAVEMTKKSISFTYKNFLDDVLRIRNVKNPGIRDQKIEELYFLVDQPFRDWLASIQVDDTTDKKIREWYVELRDIIKGQADFLMAHANNRDYMGRKEKDSERITNIVQVYNSFLYFLNKDLSAKKGG